MKRVSDLGGRSLTFSHSLLQKTNKTREKEEQSKGCTCSASLTWTLELHLSVGGIPTGCECRRELMFLLFFMSLYRILGQKCVSRERWKTFNRKCAISRASVLDFTVMHLGGGGGEIMHVTLQHSKYVMCGCFWCSSASQKLTCHNIPHVQTELKMFLCHRLILVPLTQVPVLMEETPLAWSL